MILIFLLATSITLSNCNGDREISKLNNLVAKNCASSYLDLESEIVKHDTTHSPSWGQYLEVSSIIFRLSKIANKSVVSDQCFKHLKTIETAILSKEPWAMKVLDSSGQKESGFSWGHNYWLGSQLGCTAVQNQLQITLSSRFDRTMNEGLINQIAPFEMDYRVVYMKHKSPWQVETRFLPEHTIHVGLCLPRACDSYDIRNLTQSLMDANKFGESKFLELNSEVLYVKDLRLRDNFFEQKSFKIFTGLVNVTLVLTILAWFFRNKKLGVRVERIPSRLMSFIKCFDLVKNAEDLFITTDSSPNLIPIINGLRTVACVWIMIGHVVIFMFFATNNKTFAMSYVEEPYFQFICVLGLVVDVFFTISGFLQTYNFLRSAKKLDEIRKNRFVQNLRAFGKSVFKRYLRLAPLEIIIIATVALFTSYIEDVSVFHIIERFDQTCSKYWWRNVLFIQNFFDYTELCLNWSWSLSCEMQFFLLITASLFIYAKHPKFIRNLIVAVLTASVGWTYIVGFKNNYQFSFDVQMYTISDMYINPLIRIVPYIIGSIAGWYFAEVKGNIKIDSTTEKFVWNTAALGLIACTYSNFKKDLSPFSTITVLIASRMCTSMIVCWMIIASASGRGIWWSRILEGKLFQHIGRLSFAIYLVNPFVIVFIFSLSYYSTYVDPIHMCVLSCGVGVFVYLMSVIFSLLFEIPYCNWSSLLSKRSIKTD